MPASFLVVACEAGVESVCKRHMGLAHPSLRFAFSRPGFLTFKQTAAPVPPNWEPRCAFARLTAQSLGPVRGELEQRREDFWATAPAAQHLHVWARVPRLGDKEQDLVGEALACLQPDAFARQMAVNQTARAGDAIVDCILVEPDQWWIAYREAMSVSSRWVGGMPTIDAPDSVVSRAYYKMKEALLWSRLPIEHGDCVAEIGSAPGGSCQALLDLNLNIEVIGIDPAEMDPVVATHPRFTHIRRRGSEVRRRDLAQAQWLSVDSNVAPQHTLDTLRALHEHDKIHFKGMLINLKMPQWDLADQLDDYLSQIHEMGYAVVKPRHLHHNRQELCVAALRSKSLLRKPRRKK